MKKKKASKKKKVRTYKAFNGYVMIPEESPGIMYMFKTERSRKELVELMQKEIPEFEGCSMSLNALTIYIEN